MQSPEGTFEPEERAPELEEPVTERPTLTLVPDQPEHASEQAPAPLQPASKAEIIANPHNKVGVAPPTGEGYDAGFAGTASAFELNEFNENLKIQSQQSTEAEHQAAA